MTYQPIPILDILSIHPSLTWREIQWAYKRRLIGWRDPVSIAKDRVHRGSTNHAEQELAQIDKERTDLIPTLLQDITQTEVPEEEYSIQRLWLYILLRWIYDHRSQFDDPLGKAESIAGDFQYPESTWPFLRMIPPQDGRDPARYSLAENEQYLFGRWSEYIEHEQRYFGW